MSLCVCWVHKGVNTVIIHPYDGFLRAMIRCVLNGPWSFSHTQTPCYHRKTLATTLLISTWSNYPLFAQWGVFSSSERGDEAGKPWWSIYLSWLISHLDLKKKKSQVSWCFILKSSKEIQTLCPIDVCLAVLLRRACLKTFWPLSLSCTLVRLILNPALGPSNCCKCLTFSSLIEHRVSLYITCVFFFFFLWLGIVWGFNAKIHRFLKWANLI